MADNQDEGSNCSRRDALRLLAIGGAAALVAPNLLGGPAFAASPAGKATGRVIVGLSQEPTVFNPLMAHLEVDDGVYFSLFDALFRTDPQGVIQPNLATEVPSQKNGGISEDGLNWRIRLRSDVRWHDGKPFTAEDVKYSLELITNPKFRAWRTAGHSLVRDIAVVSPTEITWRMEKAFAPYLSFLTETFILPQHLLAKEADPNATAFIRAPVGTGAFKWGQRIAGDRLELVANDDYFGTGPFIKQLIFKYIPDINVMYTQFLSGDIDLVGNAYIPPDKYADAKKLAGRTVELMPSTSFEFILLNQERPQFKDLAVRRALYAALDRQTIVDTIYYGVPSLTETFMPKQSYFYNKTLPEQKFSLETARQILDQAGWKPGAGGIREKDGVRLSFTNSTTAGDQLREQVQQFIQQSYAQIGVEMTISNMPAAVLFADFWTYSRFDSAIVGSNYLTGTDPDVTNRFHSKSIPAKGGSGSNNAQYSNAEVDELLTKGSATFDPDARRAIYNRIQEIVRHDLPLLPLYSRTLVYGRKSTIDGFTANANTRTESWNAAAWKIKS